MNYICNGDRALVCVHFLISSLRRWERGYTSQYVSCSLKAILMNRAEKNKTKENYKPVKSVDQNKGLF